MSGRSRAGLCWRCVRVRGPPLYWHSEKDDIVCERSVCRFHDCVGRRCIVNDALTRWSLSLMHAMCKAVRPPSLALRFPAVSWRSWGFSKTWRQNHFVLAKFYLAVAHISTWKSKLKQTLSGSYTSSWSHDLASGSVTAWSSNSVMMGPAGPVSDAATCSG